ncbi:MAG: ABC transporter permease subunit [Anaerolineae bacterium]
MQVSRVFKAEQPSTRPITLGDVVVIIGVVTVIYGGVRLAFDAPAEIEGPTISLAPQALPWYAALSVGRMLAAYLLSMLFTLVYGRLAAYNRRAERLLMPLLDVLQSVPILSFLPVVLLSLSAILPEGLAVELASIVLIFTSQVWNLTFAWYQSLVTIPKELREASTIFRFNPWMRFTSLELPFATTSLIWNSMMSWAGGWFFLMAAEIFTVGQRDFRLPGLGAYLQEAANQGDTSAIVSGIAALVLVIVALDQLVWRPLLAWSDRFTLEMVSKDAPPRSWFYSALRRARVVDWLRRVWGKLALGERLNAALARRFVSGTTPDSTPGRPWLLYLTAGLVGIVLLYGAYRAGGMLLTVPLSQWQDIGLGLVATLLRVALVLTIALAWTLPVGVAIGTNPRLAAVLQPIVQIAASVPATALLPVFLLAVLDLPHGVNIAAILVMLLGGQWYLLFNIIAGANAIPQDLKYTTQMLHLGRWARWRTLILPALFPYIITGAITASGGAWNASIVAEHAEFQGRTLQTTGIGALIAQATASGDYPLLLAATLTMIMTVVIINRVVWRRLYRLAEEKYRME